MVFSIPSFTTVGDDYDKKSPDKKNSGRTFLTPAPKTGNLPDACFDKEFKSIHEGDPYIEPGVAERRARIEAEKKKVTSTGFRLTNPPKKGSGLGSYYGTFYDKPLPHETDYIVPRKGESPPRREPAKRPIFTAPTKKGTYGVAGTLISNIGTDHVADFYDAPRMKEQEERERHKKLLKGAPWRPTGTRKGFTFDEDISTGVSSCYKLTKPLEEKKEFKSQFRVKGPDTPWRPGGKIPSRLPPVEYREDPYDGYDPRQSPRNAREHSKEPSRPSWKPNGSTNDTWYTKSIAFARL